MISNDAVIRVNAVINLILIGITGIFPEECQEVIVWTTGETVSLKMGYQYRYLEFFSIF